MTTRLKQFVVTPAMGKRLIAKAIIRRDDVQRAAREHTLAILCGSTNGYIAEEILAELGQSEGFSRVGFRRGRVLPPDFDAAGLPEEFPTDVIITGGKWRRGQAIADVVGELGKDDIILKGGNALDLELGKAAVLVGHPEGGTAVVSLPAVVGRRTRMITPIGVEKRIPGDLDELASRLNAPTASGPRLLPLHSEVFTELDAIKQLTGASAMLVSAGGIWGAEGSAWLAVEGTDQQTAATEELIKSLEVEPQCKV